MFLNVMVNQVRPQEEAQERFRKRKFLILTDSRNRRHYIPHGSQGKCQVLVRRQKAGARESLGQSRYWGFLRRDKANWLALKGPVSPQPERFLRCHNIILYKKYK